jgi:hypothetical protein
MRGKQFHHDGIMARYDTRGRVGKLQKNAISLRHVADVQDDGKWIVVRQGRVKMRRVRREDDPAPHSVHAHHLHSTGKATGPMKADPRRQIVVAVVKLDSAAIEVANDVDDIFDIARGVPRAVYT